MQKWVTPMKRVGKIDQENGMVQYIWMCGSQDMEVWKSGKRIKNAWVSIFFWFSKIDISRTVHPYIVSHTIFLIIFSSSFHWCHSFLHLGNYKSRYFLRIRWLTGEYQENGCNLSPIAQINSIRAVLGSWESCLTGVWVSIYSEKVQIKPDLVLHYCYYLLSVSIMNENSKCILYG